MWWYHLSLTPDLLRVFQLKTQGMVGEDPLCGGITQALAYLQHDGSHHSLQGRHYSQDFFNVLSAANDFQFVLVI